MSTITPEMKREWSQNLQHRVMRLLLLHDRPLFRGQFRTFYAKSSLPHIPILQQYDRYLKLVELSDELLDDIMPRIRRQLSLQTDRTRLCEQAPTRGSIDWRRTIQRNWRELPDQPALRFDTRLRQKSTATLENKLTVAILLGYQTELRGLRREGLGDEGLAGQELQILAGAAERIERELAAPYARALLGEARQSDLTYLVDQAEAQLRPGANPYRDLINWWRKVKKLQIGRSPDTEAITLASKRDDKKMEAWLYELWITLEFIHFLDNERELVADGTSIIEIKETNRLQFLFTWRDKEQHYRFRYNRQRKEASGEAALWENAPDTRPDYTIEREEEQQLVVSYLDSATGKKVEVWHEPPVVLDAKYYLRNSFADRAHGPIRKLLSDMTLLYIYQVILFFPLLADVKPGEPIPITVEPKRHYHSTGRQQESQIRLYQLQPNMDVETVQRCLQEVLDHAKLHLPVRPVPTCQGMWLDPDTINASAKTLTAYNIICPKPHIGENVFDLVHSEKHCLKDPRLCHVFGQPRIEPPRIVRVTTRDGLLQQSTALRTQQDQELRRLEQGDEAAQNEAELMREHILDNVGRVIEQYAKLRGNTRAIEENFKRWIFPGHWMEGSRQLADKTRDMLVSGEYVWYEYSDSNLNDWAAPAIQYCRALEYEVRRRLYYQRSRDFRFRRGTRWTLGTLLYLYTHRHARSGDDAHNWSIIVDLVAAAGSSLTEFEGVVDRFVTAQIVDHRNHLAHGEPVPQSIAEGLRNNIIGDRGQPGILCWLIENLDPPSNN
jgi:hypothetical protein